MKKCERVLGRIIGIVFLCAVPSCRLQFLDTGDGAGTTPSTFAERRAEDRYLEWCQSLPNYIIPRMCDYYQLHPERFKPTGEGEQIEIVGFAAFIKNDDYFKSGTRCYIVNGTIFDPWGDPLEFVQDLNMDGYIEAKGERRIVLNIGQTRLINQKHHFGICKHSPFKGTEGKPWERIFAATY